MRNHLAGKKKYCLFQPITFTKVQEAVVLYEMAGKKKKMEISQGPVKHRLNGFFKFQLLNHLFLRLRN